MSRFAVCYDQVIAGIKCKTFDKDQQDEQRSYLTGVIRDAFKSLYDTETVSHVENQQKIQRLQLAQSARKVAAEHADISRRREDVEANICGIEALAVHKKRLLERELEHITRRKAELGARESEIARRLSELQTTEQAVRDHLPAGGSEAVPSSSGSAAPSATSPSTSAASKTGVSDPPSETESSAVDMPTSDEAPTSASPTTDTAPPA
ncbi:uncharacterized protein LOC62_01G000172 [Vanrija pseudolonga]|uniref:Uncharacterized protein n=1 Tax=Vanrija pseudolonga TaxID=143232 RepID=A0AAF1BGP2_9TREE|nr:hypothetical protein LOC62_01G000172 [Vanrija pseudolonga]